MTSTLSIMIRYLADRLPYEWREGTIGYRELISYCLALESFRAEGFQNPNASAALSTT